MKLSYGYNYGELLHYIRKFAIDNDWEDENVPEQIRAFFTTWAFLFHVDVDTRSCTQALFAIYILAGLDEIISYNDFESFMVELIV